MIREANLAMSQLTLIGAINYILYLVANIISEVDLHFSPSSGTFVTFYVIKSELLT